MGEFKLQTKFTQEMPDLADVDLVMKGIALSIANDGRANIRRQVSPDGTPFTGLAKSTIKSKRSRKSRTPTKALIDKGIMLRAIRVFKIKKNAYAVGVAARGKPRRDLVGLIHQEIGVLSKLGRIVRPFLGISKKREQWINLRLRRWINSKLIKTQRRVIQVKT
jgi:hypothetical protein